MIVSEAPNENENVFGFDKKFLTFIADPLDRLAVHLQNAILSCSLHFLLNFAATLLDAVQQLNLLLQQRLNLDNSRRSGILFSDSSSLQENF